MELIIMKRQIARIIPLLLIAFAFAWSPVLADGDDLEEYKIRITNESNQYFVIKFFGDENFTFEIAPESSSKKTLLEGDYDYFYEVCDGDFEGEITIEDNDSVIKVYDCRIQPVPTKFVVESHFEGPLEIDMTGPLQVSALSEDFSIKASLGNNRYDIDSGFYTYSYDACDTTFSGQIEVVKSGITKLRLTSCEALTRRALRAEFGPLDPVKFRVANRFAVDIDLTLIGPQSYFLTVAPGMSRMEIVAGTYNFIFAAFGIRYEGIIEVSPNGNTILTIPFSVSSTEKM